MYHDLDVLFLGGVFPKEKEEEFINNSKGAIQNAANNLQWELIRGLDENLNGNLTILNSPYVGSYPKRYKKTRVETFGFSHNNNSKDINVGFLNLPGIKNISKYISLKPHIRDWVFSAKSSNKIIIAYAMTAPFTHTLKYAKKLNPNIKICLIVPDLPRLMRTKKQKTFLYSILKEFDIRIINKDMEYIDSYVLLTGEMKKELNISAPCIVIEGVSTNAFDSISETKTKFKTVLYSGGLSEEYGVLDLIYSFNKLKNDDYRLIICGSGDIEDEIKEICKKDKRIIFKGLIRREEVLRLQVSSTVLVNPRSNNFSFTKYSFPSKIMEYMSSGTPVLAYMLDGMPNEYRDYIYTINENEENALYCALKSVLEKKEEELYEKGKKAKEFVLHEKNRKRQCEKILDMLSNII